MYKRQLLELAKVREFDDLVHVLAHTPYREIVQKFAPQDEEPVSYTHLGSVQQWTLTDLQFPLPMKIAVHSVPLNPYKA